MNLKWQQIGEGREELVDLDDAPFNQRPRLYGAVIGDEGIIIDPNSGFRGEGGRILERGVGKPFVERQVAIRLCMGGQ